MAFSEGTYQTFPLHTEVYKWSPTHDLWVVGDITAITTVSHEDGRMGIKTTYTVSYYEDSGENEELTPEEVEERIRRWYIHTGGDSTVLQPEP